jgi:hypothetical protein
MNFFLCSLPIRLMAGLVIFDGLLAYLYWPGGG